MTIQEKIDEVVGQVQDLVTQAADARKTARAAKGTKSAKSTGAKSVKKTLDTAADMPTAGDLESTLSGVKQLGNEWIETNAHARAAAIVLGIDPLTSMFRTTINTMGDIAVTTALSKNEDMMDEAVYMDTSDAA